jgi:hypothetical protein
MELEYMLLLLPNLESYCTMFKLQMCLWVGVIPPMIGKMINVEYIFAMWAVNDIEFKEYLICNLIHG